MGIFKNNVLSPHSVHGAWRLVLIPKTLNLLFLILRIAELPSNLMSVTKVQVGKPKSLPYPCEYYDITNVKIRKWSNAYFKPILRIADFSFVLKFHSLRIAFGPSLSKHNEHNSNTVQSHSSILCSRVIIPLLAGLQSYFVSKQHPFRGAITYCSWRLVSHWHITSRFTVHAWCLSC